MMGAATPSGTPIVSAAGPVAGAGTAHPCERVRGAGTPSGADDAERVACDTQLALLEATHDGTAFGAGYREQVAAARERLSQT